MMATEDRREIPQAVEDHSTLRGEPTDHETLYTIALRGFIDERCAEAFRIAQTESTSYKRFRLDRATATISFTCRNVDGPVFVFDVLERLEALRKSVNERVEFWHTQNPAVTSAFGVRGVA